VTQNEEVKLLPNSLEYAISRTGIFWSRVRGRWKVLSPFVAKDGYKYIDYGKGQNRTRSAVHVLVLTVWDRPPKLGEHCRHLDNNKMNCHIDNLTWGTRKENEADKVIHGTDNNRGSKNIFAKLTKEQVIQCKNEYAEMKRKNPSGKSGAVLHLAKKYRITDGQMSKLLRGITYIDV
jgi:HNH endonuclease